MTRPGGCVRAARGQAVCGDNNDTACGWCYVHRWQFEEWYAWLERKASTLSLDSEDDRERLAVMLADAVGEVPL